MIIRSHKYRRLTPEKAGSVTVASGDTLTVASGGTLTVASGATMTQTGGTFTSPVLSGAILTRPVVAATATTVLTASQSGSLVTLGTAGGFDTKLPAPAAGLEFDFVVKVAPTTVYTITTNGTTQNVIHGNVVTPQDAGGTSDKTAGTPVDVITFAANKALIGDRVHVVCDGTLWYATAYAAVFDGITFD